jgi:hypothetical protein
MASNYIGKPIKLNDQNNFGFLNYYCLLHTIASIVFYTIVLVVKLVYGNMASDFRVEKSFKSMYVYNKKKNELYYIFLCVKLFTDSYCYLFKLLLTVYGDGEYEDAWNHSLVVYLLLS